MAVGGLPSIMVNLALASSAGSKATGRGPLVLIFEILAINSIIGNVPTTGETCVVEITTTMPP